MVGVCFCLANGADATGLSGADNFGLQATDGILFAAEIRPRIRARDDWGGLEGIVG